MERYSYGGNNRSGIFQRAPMAGARNKIKKKRGKKRKRKARNFNAHKSRKLLSGHYRGPFTLSLAVGLAMPAVIRRTRCADDSFDRQGRGYAVITKLLRRPQERRGARDVAVASGDDAPQLCRNTNLLARARAFPVLVFNAIEESNRQISIVLFLAFSLSPLPPPPSLCLSLYFSLFVSLILSATHPRLGKMRRRRGGKLYRLEALRQGERARSLCLAPDDPLSCNPDGGYPARAVRRSGFYSTCSIGDKHEAAFRRPLTPNRHSGAVLQQIWRLRLI